MPYPVWSVRLWRILLVVGAVGVLATALHSVWHLHSLAHRPDPADLSNAADGMARLVEAYVTRTITITGMIANSPTVSEALEKASNVPRDDEKIAAEQKRWDASPGGRNDPYRRIEKVPASVFLAELTRAPGSQYREFLIADKVGRLVAASNRTEDYNQADDPWWPHDLDHMPGVCRHAVATCVSLDDVAHDPSANAYGFSVYVPSFSSHREPIGVLKAVVDPTELMSFVQLTQMQPSIRVALINGEGKAVFGGELFLPDVSKDLKTLVEGSERILRLRSTPAAGVVHVRRLSGPMGKAWYVSAQSVASPAPRRWRPFLVWSGFALGMFVIAVLAIRNERREPAHVTYDERIVS